MPLKGNAGWKYTPPGGSETTVNLNWPLMPKETDHRQNRSVVQSDDLSTEEVTVVGDGNAVLVGQMRAIDNPDEVRQMLRYAAEGVQIDYYPDLAQATKYPSFLLNKREAKNLSVDPGRESFKEFQTTVRIERRDGGDYDGLIT